MQNLESIKRYFTVRRSDIVYLRSVIESYEGLAVLSTVDGKTGMVSLSVPRCFAGEVDGLVRALENEIAIREIMCSKGSVDPVEYNDGRENKINA